MDPKGKVALITGGAGGIGAEIARHLVMAGARVVIADLDGSRAAVVAAELGPQHALAVALDVTNADNWAAVRIEAERVFGAVDILVNNAGVGFTSGLDSISLDAWRWVYEVNVVASIHGLRTFLPAMKQRNAGHVVFMCSITALHPFAQQGAYTTSKAALLNMAAVLKRELVATGIGITAVCPGIVATDIRRNAVQARPSNLGARDEVSWVSVQSGMHPAFIGKAVVDAICDGRFYVFTHADYAEPIASERDRMLAAMEYSADPDYREPAILLEPLP
jgi:NAD(P)-dependent dehydrogenase (short-subunit alcohol dehydrogenase family)